MPFAVQAQEAEDERKVDEERARTDQLFEALCIGRLHERVCPRCGITDARLRGAGEDWRNTGEWWECASRQQCDARQLANEMGAFASLPDL